jgi:hypothetical protein
MEILLRRFLRAGVRRGLAGNWYWFLLAGATFLLRRALLDRPGAVSTFTVAPGEQVLISVRDGKASAEPVAPTSRPVAAATVDA